MLAYITLHFPNKKFVTENKPPSMTVALTWEDVRESNDSNYVQPGINMHIVKKANRYAHVYSL